MTESDQMQDYNQAEQVANQLHLHLHIQFGKNYQVVVIQIRTFLLAHK